MINYTKGEKKTNESIAKMNKEGKHFVGAHATPVVPAKPAPKAPPKPAPKKKK